MNTFFSKEKDEDNNIINNHNNSIILQRELEKWHSFSSILRKPNRDLFNEMLQSSYKYSNAINAKGENYYNRIIDNVFIFEQYKIKNVRLYFI